MLTELLAEQVKDPFCREVAATVAMPSSGYSYDHHSVLVYSTQLNISVQTMVPDPFLPLLPYLAN